MMMLSAILLLIGFVALAGMMARVNQLATQTTSESTRLILGEVGPVRRSLDDAVLRLRAPTSQQGLGLGTATTPTLEQAVVGLLEQQEELEASRGFVMDYSIACGGTTAAPTTANSVISVHLSDGEVWTQIVLTTTMTRSTGCAPTLGVCPTPAVLDAANRCLLLG